MVIYSGVSYVTGKYSQRVALRQKKKKNLYLHNNLDKFCAYVPQYATDEYNDHDLREISR
jgi:hypothetical protein